MSDTELIDWLEKGAGEYDVFIDRDPPFLDGPSHFTVRLWPKTGPGPEFWGKTLREALTAAASQSPSMKPETSFGVLDAFRDVVAVLRKVEPAKRTLVLKLATELVNTEQAARSTLFPVDLNLNDKPLET